MLYLCDTCFHLKRRSDSGIQRITECSICHNQANCTECEEGAPVETKPVPDEKDALIADLQKTVAKTAEERDALAELLKDRQRDVEALDLKAAGQLDDIERLTGALTRAQNDLKAAQELLQQSTGQAV